jgi:hypothetical protein
VEVLNVPRLRLDGVRPHVSPLPGEMEEARVTVPVKPFSPTTMIVEVDGIPASTETLVVPDTTTKSWTVKATVIERMRDALVPVTLTVYIPAVEPIHERVEEAVVPSVTLEGTSEHARPVVGDTDSVRSTLPVKPFRAVTTRLETPPVPSVTVTSPGRAFMLKSWTVNATPVECDNDPLVPVTLTW